MYGRTCLTRFGTAYGLYHFLLLFPVLIATGGSFLQAWKARIPDSRFIFASFAGTLERTKGGGVGVWRPRARAGARAAAGQGARFAVWVGARNGARVGARGATLV